ncbi:MAG: hypothetical protein QXH08_03440 [Candidatus Hadarchaeales archaeon]
MEALPPKGRCPRCDSKVRIRGALERWEVFEIFEDTEHPLLLESITRPEPKAYKFYAWKCPQCGARERLPEILSLKDF